MTGAMTPPPADILDEVFAALERPELEPDPARDWTVALPQLAGLRSRLEEAMAAVGDDGEDRRWCADVAGMVAAACLAAGKQGPALRLLGRAEALAAEGPQREGFAAALRDPAAFRKLVHDAWLARAGDRGPARPAERAPSRPGERAEVRPAQRMPVRPAERVPGPPPAPPQRGFWRWVVFAGMLALVGALSARSCLNDPDRQVARKLDAARAFERTATPEQALRRYERLLDDFDPDKADLSGAGAAIIRLLADRVPKPLTVAEADRAQRVINRFEAFTGSARGRTVADVLAERILAWTVELGDSDVERLAVARRFLSRARTLPPSDVMAVRVRERWVAVTQALAARLVAGEPLEAFALLVDLDADGADGAGRILDRFVGENSLLVELEPQVKRWLAVAEPLPATTALAERVKSRLALAQLAAANPDRIALLAGDDQSALFAALAKDPRDQEVAAALVALLIAGGARSQAILVLEELGPPGTLTARNRLLLASLVSDEGDLARADALLTGRADREARLQLAGVKLRRAARAEDPERRALLGQAESLLLSLRGAGATSAEEQLRLGEVYYRLGRIADGERELQNAIAGGTVRTALDAADVYRGLGHDEKARAALVPLLQARSTSQDDREEIALLLSLMADTVEEEEKWLRQAGAGLQVRMNLLSIEADRLAAQGDRAAADARYAEVVVGYENDVAASYAANNTALALERRTEVRGDPAFVERGIQLLEQAVVAHPNDVIALGNLAQLHWDLARWRSLARWVDLQSAPLSMVDVATILDALSRSGVGETIAARLRTDPNAARALELFRRKRILAPDWLPGYAREAEIHELRRDVAGQRALLEQLAPAGEVPEPPAAAVEPPASRVAAPGAAAEQPASKVESHEARGEAPRPPAEEGSPRRRAIAWFFFARDLQQSGAGLDQVLVAHRVAHEKWPELGTERAAAWLRISRALDAAAAADPVFREEWDREPDGREMGLALLRCLEGPRGAAVRAAMLAQPEFREAAGQALAAGRRLDLGDYALAVALGDARQLERTAAVFGDETELLRVRVGAALDPDDEEARLLRDRLDKGR